MFTNSYTCKYIEDDNCASVKVEGMKEKQKIVSCTVCGLIEKYLFHLPQWSHRWMCCLEQKPPDFSLRHNMEDFSASEANAARAWIEVIKSFFSSRSVDVSVDDEDDDVETEVLDTKSKKPASILEFGLINL